MGIGLDSKKLRVHDFDALMSAFGSDWEQSGPKELHPRLRSGVVGEHGAHVHLHLLDERPQHASENIVRAAAVTRDPQILAVQARDPDIEPDVHVMQDLPNHGKVLPIELSRDAVAALAETKFGSEFGLEIDQYGAEGYPGFRWLAELLLRKSPYPTQRCRLSLEFRTEDHVKVFSRGVEDPYDASGWLDQLAAEISAWKGEQPAGFTVTAAHALLQQNLAIYHYSGLGLGLDGPLLRLLAANGCDLTIRTRIGPALVFLRGA